MRPWGPGWRHTHQGVPSDHFVSTREPSVRVNHMGRVTALVADATTMDDTTAPQLLFGALAVHHTPTDDGDWDGGAAEANLGDDPTEAALREEYAWVDPDADAETKSAYAFPHHEVSDDGDVCAANTTACSSGIGVLNGGRGADSSAAWWDDRQGIYDHLAAHLSDAGVADDDIPDLDDAAVASARVAVRAEFDTEGVHFMGAGRTDLVHTRSDERVGLMSDADLLAHGQQAPSRSNERRTAVRNPAHLAQLIRERKEADASVERTVCAIHGQDGTLLAGGLDLAVRWDPDADGDPIFDRESRTWKPTKGAFVSTLPEAAAGADLPQIVDDPGAAWHAVLCVEGLKTDEYPARVFVPGSVEWGDLPLTLRYIVSDEGGHWGAITCGRIDVIERGEQDGFNIITGSGVFGSDEHGQIAQLAVGEQTQRFVSVDLRPDYEVELVEIIAAEIRSDPYDWDDEGDVDAEEDWWLEYTKTPLGATTIVSMPAFQQAVIALASETLPTTPIAVANAKDRGTVTADGGPLEPPGEWFEDPGFHVGDPRLVRQPDGKYACPLTVTDDGRVFGHACYWGQRHTANGRTPPHSAAGLAYYLTGHGVKCLDGQMVHGVGQITMGCGHAALSLEYAEAKAHYDGGYGALAVADIRAGEDDFGTWIAGAMRSDLTAEQVRNFKACNLSGDWREIGPGLELVALLAGVNVPGFPIARRDAMAAAADQGLGAAEIRSLDLALAPLATRTGFAADGRVTSLVAAGCVQRRNPEERLAQLERFVDELMGDLGTRRLIEKRAAATAALAEVVPA